MKAKLGEVGRTARIVIISLTLVGAGPAAGADDYGWIAGFNAGRAKLRDNGSETSNFSVNQTTSFDDTDTVWSVFGGYQFTRYFSVAGGYLDLGSYSAQFASFGGYSDHIKVDGFHLAGIGNLPVGERVSLTGTAGVYRWNYKLNSPATATDPARSLSDTGVSPTLGLGVNIDIFSKRGTYLHVGWQRFFKVGKRETVEHENDYDLFLIGIVYNFSKLAEGGVRK